MTSKLLYLVLFFSIYMNAQTTIVEEKFEKDNVPLSYQYLPKTNKLIIEKGKYKSMSTHRMITNINKLDINGKKEVLAENGEWMNCVFSATENTFKIEDYSKFSYAQTFKYVVNGKETPTFKYSEQSSAHRGFFGPKYFSDKYEIGLIISTNKSSSVNKKKGYPFELKDIFKSNTKIIDVEKPDFSRFTGDAFVKPYEDRLAIKASIIDNEKIEIISKSISKDYKTSVLYRKNYNFEGETLNEPSFTVNLKDYFLIYSNNGGGKLGSKQTYQSSNLYGASLEFAIFADNHFINNFCEDLTNGDVYIYGLFGKKANEVNVGNSPLGYYVFKFDKTGKKIWESINIINDVKGFNEKNILVHVFSDLKIYNNKLYFSTGTDSSNEYIHYSFLDKNTGAILSKNKISFKENKVTDLKYFLYSGCEYEGYKKKMFDHDGLVALDSNIKFKEYLKSLNNKNSLYFKTIFSHEGIWLIETDNEDYYKVTFFKD
ncbi:MAG TPA: hypothetical protein VIV55_09730 [Flavobacterium sp.]